MQKKRSRGTARQTASEGGAERTPVGTGRPTHVRNRLIVAVAVVAAAIAGAGAPSVLAASGQLSDSQELVTLAGRTQDALALAHSLADERDEVTSYVAAGRPKSKAPSEQRSARVDRQVDDLRADTDTPAWLRSDLDGIAAVRRAALTGKSTALEAHQAYSAAIGELHRLAEDLAEQMPPRAGAGAHALAELDSAVQQSAAARGLLLAALNVPSTTQTVIDPLTGLPSTTSTTSAADKKQRDALSAAAQQARLRSDAALADFRDTAPKSAVDSYDSTVTGPEVNSAEKYLAQLTDGPTLSDGDLGISAKKLDAALSARVDQMRGAEAALYDHRTKDLAQLRDDDVTAWEIRIAVLGALMLVAVGVATAMARTLTRPLSVLRRGSARLAESENPAAEEPVKFTGRNDEFAQVVRSVNALHAHAAALHERIATLESDRKHLVGQRQKMADAREELRTEVADAAAQLERLRASIGGTFVNLALRTLGLVERQLAVIEGLEEREQDPERLSTLFKLDHFATVMRRHSENLLVLAGTEHVQQHHGPVPLVDVVRAAVSEIERYERVRIAALPPHAHVVGFAADDLSHLLAELMENATSFSPPDAHVEVSGWLLESGEVMLSVQDEGIGMTGERLAHFNSRLADFDPDSPYEQEGDEGLGLGLYVVARLAHRHGARVQLREQKQGGIAAVVVLPGALLAQAPATAVPPTATVPGGTHTFSLPGADAEANSNVLHGRAKDTDPLVALAEQATRETPNGKPTPAGTPSGAFAESPAQTAAGAFAEAPSRPAAEAAAGVSAETSAGSFAEVPAQASAETSSGAFAEAPSRAAAETAFGASAETSSGAFAEASSRPAAEIPAGVSDETAAGAFAEAAAGASAQTSEGAFSEVPAQASAEVPSRAAEAAARASAETPTGAFAQAPFRPAAETSPGPSAEAPSLPAAEIPAGPSAEAPARPFAEAPARTPAEAPTRPSVETPAGPSVEVPVEAPAETTMELLAPVPVADPYAIGPDAHERTPDEAVVPAPAAEVAEAADAEDEVTSKGLPKRTPKITSPDRAPRQRTGSVDAEALRRRLGGFRRGAEAGRRDVEAEIAEETAQNERPDAAPAHAGDVTGGTVEEASS
ncbi:nitrate- and nitrite sensing domain-containing protein [Streptomyces sp. NPDC050625]|uniref:sensor histidine kinase n=1 Tax=Streptomyces sp. NPDC050625 TaxID=3154629 RepID=UPI00342DEA36